MQIDILTLFPKMFAGPFHESIIKRAVEKKLVTINIHNLRRFAIDQRGTVDDRPFAGGPGMILRPEPIDRALRALKLKMKNSKLKITKQNSKIILLSASGKPYTQEKARKLSKMAWLVLICGHYEGVDQRVADFLVDEEISIGDYILTGGEIPTMVITDSIVRLIHGVLGKSAATTIESFSPNYLITSESRKAGRAELLNYSPKAKLLEFPQYTRPQNFRGHKVPPILLAGHHQKIEAWRKQQALQRTKKFRPELLTNSS